MSDVPFGFQPPDPDDRERRGDAEKQPGGERPGGSGPQGLPPGGGFPPGFGSFPGGAGAFDFGQLGQMLTQLGQMLSHATTSGGPVNYDLAKQLAVQRLATEGAAGAGSSASDQAGAVADSVRLAELWLDAATALPAGARVTQAWTGEEWINRTLPTWQRLCDPVAQRVAGAWVDAMPAEAKQAAGPLLSMLGQMGGLAFGSQLGNALGQLAAEVLTSTDVGLPLGEEGVAALLPGNIERFTAGLERPASEVMVFLAAREAAHQRLFTHVPWLRQRLLATVEEYARGIRVDTSALEQLAGQVDPSNPASIEEAMRSGLLEPQTTPEQKAALARLETLLALVEGWVDVVVGDAVGERLPGADALRETLRRRRASGGPAEQTFATLVGLELRPRRLRAAAALWRLVGDQHGLEARDGVWAHPDLVPTAEDLDDPFAFSERLGAGANELEDPLAALEREKQRREAEGRPEPGASDERPDEGPGADGR
ncbi:putative hydrolase [Streptoalloteichus tenebrarius]|uniref:Hydrolase n=1 Tax=Streptoalloteichus tenebrarius (strain ATCC 17920 / DSM 40477 / JCM 4838 / CBS 697.72 / NBRC 16177 / NCIMB 11028 / NRRL B-12390 / A12253. 1 / ISP 5477) TaxID=1933 RepID=A0ABT1HVU7_STRSD|nr:zinc-dependent metalloprotease [Streptoalloteichus tenebrarius]MCP2259647.1 putative hydrolase [Streptoalloteichus tenebrarius]BFF00946.1 zinc-dependent metalloprotease [Streptoalloteichus tenebrarius]